jgi:hypothetical protein
VTGTPALPHGPDAGGPDSLLNPHGLAGHTVVACHDRISFIRGHSTLGDDQLRALVNAPAHATVTRGAAVPEFGPPYMVVASRDQVSFIRVTDTADRNQLRALVNAPAHAVVLWYNPDGFDTDLITWSCHVCGRERLDQFIGVASRPAAGIHDKIPGSVNDVRYCLDCAACTAVATTAPEWPPAVAGEYCIPHHQLHAVPHRGCVPR